MGRNRQELWHAGRGALDAGAVRCALKPALSIVRPATMKRRARGKPKLLNPPGIQCNPVSRRHCIPGARRKTFILTRKDSAMPSGAKGGDKTPISARPDGVS